MAFVPQCETPSDPAQAVKPVAEPRYGMRIEHERPAPETEPHVIAPLIVVLADGTRVTARRWSLSGISDQALEGHDLGNTHLEIPFQGIDLRFQVRLQPRNSAGIWAFEGLTGRQREALGLFYRNLINGRMASTDEVITALDTPVDLIPMGETIEEKAAATAKSKPRILRVLLNVVWYVGMFLAVIGVAGHMLWSRIEGINLSHARIFAERIEMRAPHDGYLHQQLVVGTPVAAGAIIGRLVDPAIDADIARLRQRLKVLQARHDDGQQRLDQHLSMHDAVRESMLKLFSPAALARFDAGIPIKPGDYNDTRSRLEGELRDFENDLDQASGELSVLKEKSRSMEIAAPSAGTVPEWLAGENQFLRTGDSLATFEIEAPRVVRGWVDDRLANSIQPGMSADIQVVAPDGEKTLTGRVVDIMAGADPIAPDINGLIITIALPELTAAQTRAELPFNTPVEVEIKRGLLDRLLGQLLGRSN